jgi:hypothetical protein
VLAVTNTALIILDPRSLTMKYRLDIEYLEGISMSRCHDDIVVLHISPNMQETIIESNCLSCSNHVEKTNPAEQREGDDKPGGCILQPNNHHPPDFSNKGDVILHTCHAVEMVTKIYLVHKNLAARRGRGSASASYGGGPRNKMNHTTVEDNVQLLQPLPVYFDNE